MDIRAAILDDDNHFLSFFAKSLEKSFKQLGHSVEISLYNNSKELIKKLSSGDFPDVIFCDILLPGSNGINLARAIQHSCPQVKIIFMSTVLANAKEIFVANPTYFLVKPIEQQYLNNSILTLIRQLEQDDSNIIPIHCKSGSVIIRKNLVEFIETNNKVVEIHEASKIISIRLKLDSIAPALGKDFLRCHKSFLVNINYIRNMKRNSLILLSNAEIPISRRRITEIRNSLFTLAYNSLDSEVFNDV